MPSPVRVKGPVDSRRLADSSGCEDQLVCRGLCTLVALSEQGAAGPWPPHLLLLTPPSATSALSVPSPHGVFVKPSPASLELPPVPQNSGNSYPAVGFLGFTEFPTRHGITCWQAQSGTILFPDTGETWGLLVYFVCVYVCARARAESLQSCLALGDPMDCSQGPLSIGSFSKQEYFSGLPFPSPGDLPSPVIEPRSPEFQADSLPSKPPRKPLGS